MCFLRRPQKLTKSSPSIWQYVVSVKSMGKILTNYVAFLENTNFTFLWITICASNDKLKFPHLKLIKSLEIWKKQWLKKECALYERVRIRSALNFWKWEWKSERTHFFSNEWELSEAQKITERWTRCPKGIFVSFGFAMITLLVRLVRPQDCAWCPSGEMLWYIFCITLVDLSWIGSGIFIFSWLKGWFVNFFFFSFF